MLEEGLFDQFVSGVPDEKAIEEIYSLRATKHAEDAVDYEDIDELADDLPEEVPVQEGNVKKEDGFDDIFNEAEPAVTTEQEVELQQQANAEFDGFFDELDTGEKDDVFDGLGLMQVDDEIDMGEFEPPKKKRVLLEEERARKRAKVQRAVARLEAKIHKRRLRYFFPTFSEDKPFNYFLQDAPDPLYYTYQRPALAFKEHVKALIPTKVSLEVAADDRKAFKSRGPAEAPRNITNITAGDRQLIEDLENKTLLVKTVEFLDQDGTTDKFSEFNKDLILLTTDWDDAAIINAGEDNHPQAKVNDHLLKTDYDYDDESIFSGQIASDKFQLDMNDPNLLFVKDKKHQKSKALVPTNQRLLDMKFNVSNDSNYEFLKDNYNTKVRSQLSNLNIEHSVPAMRLQGPYYKVKLTKEEARAFHRPRFVVRPGSLVSFSKVKPRKKKKDKGKSMLEIFAKTSDLTAADSGYLVGMEYAEEYPYILSNFGMGSKLINYYRKESEQDNSRPKAPVGETHVLGVEDRSPFWNYGHVEKGDFVPTLYNNMIRAPIFKHEQKKTDFILIRSQGAGSHQKHYLRPFNHMYAVGQTFPAVEVPAPHSRKVTNTFKNRLKMVVFRLMNKNGVARVSVKDVSQHFPDQNDMQNRQRLKEFMEYQRQQGEDKGFWKVRGDPPIPSEEKVRLMITPEDASLLDSMQHGQQMLEDVNAVQNEKDEPPKQRYNKHKDDEERDKEKEKEERRKRRERGEDYEEDIDEELTPWSSTRNFVTSNQTKQMLQLNGEGDPTGIGIGFSLLRATQKNGFSPLIPPPKETVPKNATAAYHQKLYEEEVSRIWYSQRRSLTVDNSDPSHTLEEVYKEYKPVDHREVLKAKFDKDDKKPAKDGTGDKSNHVLRISRRIRDKNNIVQRKVEIVTDPRLIKAYIKRKKQIEGDRMSMADVGEIIPTNDAEVNKIRRKALEEKIASLQKRAKLSKGRKGNTKDPLHAAAAAGGTIIDANTVLLPDGSYAIGGKGIGKGKSTTRRCASCGAFGHIRTNKSCPLYNDTKGGTVLIPPEVKERILAEYNANKASAQSPKTPLEPATPATPTPPVQPQ